MLFCSVICVVSSYPEEASSSLDVPQASVSLFNENCTSDASKNSLGQCVTANSDIPHSLGSELTMEIKDEEILHRDSKATIVQ